jgi:hypothetical protein
VSNLKILPQIITIKPNMTAKEFVKGKFPNAISRKEIDAKDKVMWFIHLEPYDGGRYSPTIGCGLTQKGAWSNVRYNVLRQIK